MPPVPTATLAAHPADRLLDAVGRVGAPICVGLDPVLERLPEEVRASCASPVEAIRRHALGSLEAIAESVPCVKFQSACFERYGAPGVACLYETMEAARAIGLVVILDAKRGDIGVSAEHYAAAARAARADWTTVNGYLGLDGVEPFLRDDCGAFVLVRTSNPGGDRLQSLRLADGRSVAEAVADLLADASQAGGDASFGRQGYARLGAVVGATKPRDAASLRARLPRHLFLVPGYGAQGGGVDDVLPCFESDGRGAIVTASRSVLYPERRQGESWNAAVARAAAAFRDELRRGLGLR
jgi:orotidine-5'-phosphate decarboxylase